MNEDQSFLQTQRTDVTRSCLCRNCCTIYILFTVACFIVPFTAINHIPAFIVLVASSTLTHISIFTFPSYCYLQVDATHLVLDVVFRDRNCK